MGFDISLRKCHPLVPVVVAAWILCLGAVAHAADDGWGAVAVSGTVQYRAIGTAQWRPLTANAILGPAVELQSGNDGRARLVSGWDEIVISPNAQLVLPAGEQGSPVTRVIQRLGTLFFKVNKRPSGSFRVETPYLVTIVKGTAFSVEVATGGATVNVTEGIVAVAAADTGRISDVPAGRSLTIVNPAGAAAATRGRDRADAAPVLATDDAGSPPSSDEAQAEPTEDTAETQAKRTVARMRSKEESRIVAIWRSAFDSEAPPTAALWTGVGIVGIILFFPAVAYFFRFCRFLFSAVAEVFRMIAFQRARGRAGNASSADGA